MVTGGLIVVTVRAPSRGPQAPSTKVNSRTTVVMVKVRLTTRTDRSTKANGVMIRRRAQANSLGPAVQGTQVISEMTRCTALVHSLGKVAPNMRATGGTTKSLAAVR